MAFPGWGTFAGGIGAIFGKLSTYIPGKVEKLRNEKSKLEKEKNKLLMGDCDEKKSARLLVINNRLDVINGLLGNKAQD
jgi:hypothetical protein